MRGAEEVSCSAFDLMLRDCHASTVSDAWQRLPKVDVLLLATGSLPDQDACESTPTLCREALEVNFSAAAEFLLHAATRFEKQRGGVLAVIGSVAGDRGRRGNYIYGAAKAGLEAFVSGLRVRLGAAGVDVLLLKPGFVSTRMTAGMRQGLLFTSADKAGALIVRAVGRGGGTVYLPFWWRFVMGIICALPEVIFKRLKL